MKEEISRKKKISVLESVSLVIPIIAVSRNKLIKGHLVSSFIYRYEILYVNCHAVVNLN